MLLTVNVIPEMVTTEASKESGCLIFFSEFFHFCLLLVKIISIIFNQSGSSMKLSLHQLRIVPGFVSLINSGLNS